MPYMSTVLFLSQQKYFIHFHMECSLHLLWFLVYVFASLDFSHCQAYGQLQK